MENEINLYFSHTFLNQTFIDFIEENKQNFTDEEFNFLKNTKNYKTALDLEPDFITNQLNLFLTKFKTSLKSKNKNNGSFVIKPTLNFNEKSFLTMKKNFFEQHGFFHHHLISEEIYSKKFFMKFNSSSNTYEETNFDVIDGMPISEIIDNSPGSKKAQTSNLLLHYQRVGNNYRVLFITEHISGDEWNDLYKKLTLIFKDS